MTSSPSTATAAAFPPTEPLSVTTVRPPWKHTFIALSIPNFRIWTAGNFVAMTAGWMQRIAQDWLVLELTGSATAVGITVAMQFAPMLFFGLLGGAREAVRLGDHEQRLQKDGIEHGAPLAGGRRNIRSH